MVDNGENWNRAYVEAPEIFDAFCRAEDPDGLITHSVRKHAGITGQAVLEIGCGTGRYTRDWAPAAASYLALEKSPAMLELARRHCADRAGNVEFLCGDATALPLAERSFDRVLAGWVVINMRLLSRRRMLDETDRVLRSTPDAGLWLTENHWSGEFQDLRGRRSDVEAERIRKLVERYGFSVVDVVESELRFPSSDEAERILGWLCGASVRRRLRERPLDRLSHHVVILHRPAEPPVR